MHSLRIEQLLARIQDARYAASVDLRDRRVLTSNLLFLHDCVVASEQLLTDAELATHWCGELDPYGGSLGGYYLSHLDEERGHLQWLQEDLAALGVAPNDPPDMLAMAMIGTQYYLLKHRHPATLLGYLAVIEGDPAPIALVEQLEGLHGANVLRFIREHATKDLEHRVELFATIDAAPDAVFRLIEHSALSVLACLRYAARSWQDEER